MFNYNSSVQETSFHNLGGLSVAYINHKGTEFPLNNVKDFDEAIRSAKLKGRNHLDLIFYRDKLKPNEAATLNNSKSAFIGKFSNVRKVVMPFKNTSSNNSCHKGDPLPEWFTQYMKKFKKELLKDLRSNISEMIHEEFEKEKKIAEAKLSKSFFNKNEFSSPAKLKKKKKIPEKDTFDLLEKRELKLLKKIEKLYASKFDRLMYPVLYLEKLESKARILLEERRKLLEKGHQNKWRDCKKTMEPEKKDTNSGKSALFSDSEICLTLEPGTEFSVTVNIVNNGTIPWISPQMECLAMPGLCLKEPLINLPRLKPGQSATATLRGRITPRSGNYCSVHKVFDGLEEFGPLLSCFAVVSDKKEEIITNSEESNQDNKVIPTMGLVDSFIDFEEDMISSRQKKVKKNKIEIERRLQSIDPIRPCASGDESREERLSDNAEEFQVRGCDLLQGKEKTCGKERLGEDMLLEVDPWVVKLAIEKSKQTENENFESETFQTKKSGIESDSDSELSVICMPEEDENFIFVPLLSGNSNSENMNKTEKLDSKKESDEFDQKSIETILEERPIKVELKEEAVTAENCSPSKSDPTANVKVADQEGFSTKPKSSFESGFIPTNAKLAVVTSNERLGENVPGNLPSRILGNMDFPAGNTEFNPASSGSTVFPSKREMSPSINANAGGEKNEEDQSTSHYVLHNTQETCPLKNIRMENSTRKEHWNKNVPTSDCFGKPIYAVRNDGYYLPVNDLASSEVDISDVVEMAESKEEAHNGTKEATNVNFKENAMESPTITIIPNVISNASSVVTIAFNTAKSVFSNLHSALKSEMEMPGDVKKSTQHPDSLSFLYNIYQMGTEERRYVENLTNQKKYTDAMLTLHEMGFVNYELNFRLLKKYDNEVTTVVNSILDMSIVD